ncbi:hypothetical protein GDO86_001544 [Hymenochirus boettgeri]|uniref:IRF tryptophan pentad repeat domain-containing protein n=1 Tax=Hymenochirus boettgeri TaxID=247094 RepID=A0A8T2KLW7_9PIPI|nr:hypothetical protein GDO86_001544 [Hymenochirus boettgeri]
MATGRARTTRKLKPWLLEQVESGKYPGLVWDDEKKTCFRIPWKHAGKQDFRHDEDAAIFKAWAEYKNKLHPGDKLDAAAWKTRLRCALNKSPEFQEVPERSQLDISEPYKVYRIVPPGEQVTPEKNTKKTGRKRKIKVEEAESSSDEGPSIGEEKKPLMINLDPARGDDDADISSTALQDDSGIGSDSSNTETLKTGQSDLESVAPSVILPLEISHTDMQVTILYSGIEVSRYIVRSGECKLSARSPGIRSGGGMEHVALPAPDERLDKTTRTQTANLLEFLQSGVMLASNSHGIFAQRHRSCSGRVFWTGPCADAGEQPNKLERDAHVKLFDTHNFIRELERYKAEGGMLPSYEVTLCFGEEISECDTTTNKLIIAQIEQVIASELVRGTSQAISYVHSENPLLQGPPAPYQSPLLLLNEQSNIAEMYGNLVATE